MIRLEGEGRFVMASKRRFYMKKFSEYGDDDEDLLEWLDERIPPVPEGLRCEADDCYGLEKIDEVFRPLATSYSYKIKDGHVCYSYICDTCGEVCSETYLSDNESPSTEGGYAVTPQHCT